MSQTSPAFSPRGGKQGVRGRDRASRDLSRHLHWPLSNRVTLNKSFAAPLLSFPPYKEEGFDPDQSRLRSQHEEKSPSVLTSSHSSAQRGGMWDVVLGSNPSTSEMGEEWGSKWLFPILKS
jgi:hypothetical protein